MQRLRSVKRSGSSIFRYLALPQWRRKASNSWSSIQDTYFSTKDIFERHRVVFTVSTSIASVATAWIGYSLRHYHDSRVDQKLESIEAAFAVQLEVGEGLSQREKRAFKQEILKRVWEASVSDAEAATIVAEMRHNYQIGDPEFRKLVSHNVSLPSCLATAGTTLVIGYGLGWRGGRWYQTRKFRKEQMKLLGQVKPRGWSSKSLSLLQQVEFRRSLLKILKRPLTRARLPGSSSKTSETSRRNASVAQNTGENNTSL